MDRALYLCGFREKIFFIIFIQKALQYELHYVILFLSADGVTLTDCYK